MSLPGPGPFSHLRLCSLIEAKRFLFQHPQNVSTQDPIELLRDLVKEYENHLPIETRNLANSISNYEWSPTQSVSPSE